MTVGEVILTVHDIDKTFPGVRALDHVNFEARKGEVHALMGEIAKAISHEAKVSVFEGQQEIPWFSIIANACQRLCQPAAVLTV